MKTAAIRLGQSRGNASGLEEWERSGAMAVARSFSSATISFADKWLAEKQAHLLEKVLAEEHERDKKHPDQIELPD